METTLRCFLVVLAAGLCGISVQADEDADIIESKFPFLPTTDAIGTFTCTAPKLQYKVLHKDLIELATRLLRENGSLPNDAVIRSTEVRMIYAGRFDTSCPSSNSPTLKPTAAVITINTEKGKCFRREENSGVVTFGTDISILTTFRLESRNITFRTAIPVECKKAPTSPTTSVEEQAWEVRPRHDPSMESANISAIYYTQTKPFGTFGKAVQVVTYRFEIDAPLRDTWVVTADHCWGGLFDTTPQKIDYISPPGCPSKHENFVKITTPDKPGSVLEIEAVPTYFAPNEVISEYMKFYCELSVCRKDGGSGCAPTSAICGARSLKTTDSNRAIPIRPGFRVEFNQVKIDSIAPYVVEKDGSLRAYPRSFATNGPFLSTLCTGFVALVAVLGVAR